jgi:hypothetical protein
MALKENRSARAFGLISDPTGAHCIVWRARFSGQVPENTHVPAIA